MALFLMKNKSMFYDNELTYKLINLNYSALTSNNFDNGGNCGIKILGTNGDGYLQTSNDGLRYIIKAPLDPSFKYIATVDNNNNLNVNLKYFLFFYSRLF